MALRSAARWAVVATVSLGTIGTAAHAADDGGMHSFLSNLFGEAGGVAIPVAPSRGGPAARAPHRWVVSHREVTIHRRKPEVVASAGPQKPGKVSIFEDTTLRAGDAVMTADGIRIFAGSRSWPYRSADFIPLAKAHDLSRDTVKVLAGLNSLPRS